MAPRRRIVGGSPREPPATTLPERTELRWWERVRAGVCLAVLVVALGVLSALVIAVALFAFLRWGSNAVG